MGSLVYTMRDSCDTVGRMSDLEKVTDRNFAANVKAQREAIGYSKAELVRRLSALGWGSAHQTTLTRIEEGERPARLGEARLIARALRVPLHTLMRTPEALDLGTRIERRGSALQQVYDEVITCIVDLTILAHDQDLDLSRAPDDLPEAKFAREAARYGIYDANDAIQRGTTQGAAAIAEPEKHPTAIQRARDRVGSSGLAPKGDANTDPKRADRWEKSVNKWDDARAEVKSDDDSDT